jgi:hypothetical protein
MFSGPQKALCFESVALRNGAAVPFAKGDIVIVTKLYRIAAIDANYNQARVKITQAATGAEYTIYSDWPELSRVLSEAK